jgi:hypothetical protein
MSRFLLVRRRPLPLPVLVVGGLSVLLLVPVALVTLVPALVLLVVSVAAGVGIILSAWAVVELLAVIERWLERDARFRN